MTFPANVLTLLVLLSGCSGSFAQNRQQAFEMNERLGRGINMGNTFEAPTETAWGNPWEPRYFKMISALGFNHVRVPIRWETMERSMTSAPYTISEAFLERIQEVVDTALRYKLHVIINMHHHDALYDDPAGQKERFLSQWNQIANHFKGYPDSLLFEVLNEPHGNLTAPLWNDYFASALEEIRKTNPTRIVLMGVADYGGVGGISKLLLPNDENIILSVHYYNPFRFTHQGAEWVNGSHEWLGTEWRDTEAERESVESEFSYAIQFSKSNNIPVHIGEFGAYNKADMESRQRWTTFLARWFEQQRMSWAYWEFSAGFGIYDRATQQYVPGLVEALLHSHLPEPTPVFSHSVYTSDFSAGTDGWSLNAQGGASGTLAASGGKLNVSISTGGSETWHLQLVKNNLRFEKGKLYRMSFSGSAIEDRRITFYAGKASTPWSAYSGYNGVSLSTHPASFTFTFTMAGETDPVARLVFDLGTSTGAVNVSGMEVEELNFTITSLEQSGAEGKNMVYPNPVSSSLRIAEGHKYHTGNLMDLTGRSLMTVHLAPQKAVDVSRLPPGIYILWLRGNAESAKVKIVKD